MKKTKEEVTVYLKIRDRKEWNPSMLACLTKWIEACEKEEYKYIIMIGDYIGPLPKNNAEEILSNDFFKTTALGKEIVKKVNISECEGGWRAAAYVHCLPYLHNKRPITINIDADDVYHTLPLNEVLSKMLCGLEEHKATTLSYDVYFSVSIRLETRPHHWSFGVNISKTKEMKQILTEALQQRNLPNVGFCNIDYLVDYYLEHRTKGPIAAITSNGAYDHCGTIEYLPEEDCIQLKYGRDRTIRPRHERTIIV